MRIFFLFLLTVFCSSMSFAQYDESYIERTNDVTLFHNYGPAFVEMTNGKFSRVAEANIFLKRSTLVYKQGKDIMEVNMPLVKTVRFGNRHFYNTGGQLAEVLDTVGVNFLAVIRTINQEGLTHEILNKSTISNLDFNDSQMGVTRVDADPDQLLYPVDNKYCFIINGKKIVAQDREARHAAGRKRLEAFDKVVKGYGFSWMNRESLLQILHVLAD